MIITTHFEPAFEPATVSCTCNGYKNEISKDTAVSRDYIKIFFEFVKNMRIWLLMNIVPLLGVFALSRNFYCNLGQLEKKGKKSSRIGQEQKAFLSAKTKVLFLERVALGSIFTQFGHFPNISQFSKIVSLKSFGKSWGNLYTTFFMQNIKYRFTFGESKLF